MTVEAKRQRQGVKNKKPTAAVRGSASALLCLGQAFLVIEDLLLSSLSNRTVDSALKEVVP